MRWWRGATLDTLLRRIAYGGRKGRRALRRVDGVVLRHWSGATITLRKTGSGLEFVEGRR